MDCGFVSQNVYLYCASEGLGTVVRGFFDQESVKRTSRASSSQEVLLTQSVGYVK